MHHAATVVTWVAAVLGAALLVYGLVGLARPGAPHSQSALGRLWLGLFVLVETVPRLADWPSGVVLALSVLALAPLLLAVRALRRR